MIAADDGDEIKRVQYNTSINYTNASTGGIVRRTVIMQSGARELEGVINAKSIPRHLTLVMSNPRRRGKTFAGYTTTCILQTFHAKLIPSVRISPDVDNRIGMHEGWSGAIMRDDGVETLKNRQPEE